uniref:Uncharacterized protein n=1 Tax=Strigamia maritima TaxID=126957 RepID=T1JD09_STRMM
MKYQIFVKENDDGCFTNNNKKLDISTHSLTPVEFEYLCNLCKLCSFFHIAGDEEEAALPRGSNPCPTLKGNHGNRGKPPRKPHWV